MHTRYSDLMPFLPRPHNYPDYLAPKAPEQRRLPRAFRTLLPLWATICPASSIGTLLPKTAMIVSTFREPKESLAEWLPVKHDYSRSDIAQGLEKSLLTGSQQLRGMQVSAHDSSNKSKPSESYSQNPDITHSKMGPHHSFVIHTIC